MNSNLHAAFLSLVRMGIGCSANLISEGLDWKSLEALALQQGLFAIIVDGVESLGQTSRPPKEVLLRWIGFVMQAEMRYSTQQKSASQMASLFHDNSIKTYVLKGSVVAVCYPKPTHRVSADFDCFLAPLCGSFDVWSLGNDIISAKGIVISTDYYKNSTFYLPGLTVENHKFLTPFRGNKKLARLERVLQTMLLQDKEEDRFEGTWLYMPPVMVSALFLIEHAYSHFLHEGLTWRHVLDWAMFSKKHHDDIDWLTLEGKIDEYGFRRFYNSYHRLGLYLLGAISEYDLTMNDKRMLADVWAPLDLHETVRGVRGKLCLVGNTLRACWKYRYFAEISMIRALWMQVYGFLFDKHPSLD